MEKAKHLTPPLGRWLLALLLVMFTSLATHAAEAYACSSYENAVLTFYYDNYRSSRSGTTYDLNTGDNWPEWHSISQYVVFVEFDESFVNARPTSTYRWFYEMTILRNIAHLDYLNTVDVTDMGFMFGDCAKLESVDLSHFKTNKVTNMTCMFYGCTSLTNIDLRSFSTEHTSTLGSMFQGCTALETLNLNGFTIGRVVGQQTVMKGMFSNCPNLTTIYAQDWNMDNVYDHGEPMFTGCTSLLGERGTTFAQGGNNSFYARIDEAPERPGYFSSWKEPYACYTSDNTTLTFYYDGYRDSRWGTTYDLNKSFYSPQWYNDSTNYNVTQVVFDPSFADARPTTTKSWFDSMLQLQSITGMEYLNTSAVTNMNSMFGMCCNLSSIDLSHFNTSNVTSMLYMFADCFCLRSLDLSSFNTANVTDMYWMFSCCGELTTIYVGDDWSTAAVTNSEGMFDYCISLVGEQGTCYDEDNPCDKTYAHVDGGPSNPGYLSLKPEAYACYTSDNTTLTFYYDGYRNSRAGMKFDLNTGAEQPRWNMLSFVYSNVTQVVFDGSFIDARPTSTSYWFERMENLQSIKKIFCLKTSEVTNMSYMFAHCSALTSLDVSQFDVGKVTDMQYMFFDCTGLTNLELFYYDSYNVTNMRGMFVGCSGLTSLNVNHLVTENVTDMISMFSSCSSLTSLDLSHFNTANVTSMQSMFNGCTGLTSLDLSNGNTANVTNMSNMFKGCSGLTNLDLGDFNTANVTTMRFMFSGCSGLTSLDLSSWNTANVTDMGHMFQGCSGLNNLDLSHSNTANVTDMTYMFQGCSGLTSLDLSGFRTGKVTTMMGMFEDCSGLLSLNLRYFETPNVAKLGYMFQNCSNLTTIYAETQWNTAASTVNTNMFYNCTSLVGGKGTVFVPTHVGKEYAHIDGGPSDPGYFTGPEAYAVFTPGNKTLTFYCDFERSSREGTSYSMNINDNTPDWCVEHRNDVERVVFNRSFANARPTTTASWFNLMVNLQVINGMNYLNTSEVTSMHAMFRGCTSLTSVDLSGFRTDNLRETTYMFWNCTNLTTIYGSGDWNNASISSYANMFKRCTSLVGGQGTTYDNSQTGISYARIDGGPSNPGYFTEKPNFQPGDVNGDDNINITDVTMLLSLEINSGEDIAASTLPAGDVNGDGIINITDVTMLISQTLNTAK